MSRTFVIGDIHGGLRALRGVVDQVGLREGDRMIFLGDYVDGWPESRQVMEYLMELNERYACVFVKGNHDAWCEEWLEGYNPDPDWLMHGGRATVESYEGIRGRERDRHIEFFNAMEPYHEETAGGVQRLFIHAGFSSMHGPSRERHHGMFYWDRTLWEMALSVDGRIARTSVFYPKRLLLYDEIFIGHTPTTNYGIPEPMHRECVWNVDTGAAFMGRISVMDVDSKEYWQSEVVQRLYPASRGRNR